RAVLDQHAVAVAQVGAAGVGADVVAQHHVAGRARPGNINAVGVETDGVGCTPGSADRIVRRFVDGDADAVVAQVVTAGVGADVVPLNQVARGGVARDIDAGVLIGRDDVAGPRGRPPDRVVGCVVELDPLEGVAQGHGTGGVGADVVPLD